MPTRAGVAAVQRNASSARTSGDNSAVAPPVPIPNTAVKRCSPDGSAAIGRARVGHRQNKNPAGFPAGFLISRHGCAGREHAVGCLPNAAIFTCRLIGRETAQFSIARGNAY